MLILKLYSYNLHLRFLFWSEYQYKCKSGQCIDSSSTCDGTRDCMDGSDETKELCKMVQ